MTAHDTVIGTATSGIARYGFVVEDDELIRAYIAGVLDTGGTITVKVRKASGYKLGYTMVPYVRLKKNRPQLVGILDEWAMEHGVNGSVYEKGNGETEAYVWELSDRDDVERFLNEIGPYLIVESEVAQLLVSEVLPRLREGDHRSEEGFLELMEYVEQIRELHGASDEKYTREYFEKKFQKHNS